MYGCQSTRNGSSGGADLDGMDDAYALLRQAAAQSSEAKHARLRLQAARVFIYNSSYLEAIRALEPLSPDNQTLTNRDQLGRLRAQAWQGIGDFVQAEQALATLTNWQPADLLLLAEICQARGDFRCSAEGYIQATIDSGLDAEELPSDIHERIWLALSRARQAPVVFTDQDHHGWWLLQEQIRAAGSITGQIQAWRNWQSRFPSHPAAMRPPVALLKLDDYQAPQVGLLLPLSGPYASAGIAVRDGLIAAYLSEQAADKPQIKFYDSGRTPTPLLFEQALAEGADVMVGPLIKQEVEKFAAATRFSDVPRLVLNYLASPGSAPTTDSPPGMATPLFQFGIAIEDEATSLANHVLLAGVERLLVVHSQARWSQRALRAFTDSWPAPVITAEFADIKNITEAVGEAMQVAASEARRTEIANILGQQLEFLPRARSDLDGVIALTTHVESQALVPALRFHFADKLPVYATSQAAKGQDLKDIRGFELTQMPIFASPSASQQALHDAFDLARNSFAELYALGFDAYRIATWLPILNAQSQVALPAASGYLWLEPGGKFRRDLGVSRVTKGGLVPVD